MADDIVSQLQRLATTLERGEGRSTVLGAAAEIERLRAEVADWQRTVRAHEAVSEGLRALELERHDEIVRLRALRDRFSELTREARRV